MRYSILLMVLLIFVVYNAYGHGLAKEEVGPKNIGDKLVSMSVELEPEFKHADKLEDVTLHVRFYDYISEEEKNPIPGVAAYIEIYRFRDNTLLLNETFHIMSDVDDLSILFKPAEEIKIVGMKMGSFGYMRTSFNDMIVVEGPIFTTAGLYKLKITPIALDSDSLPKEDRKTFESLITLAEIKDTPLLYKGKEYVIETISYYDSITDIESNDADLSIKSYMPFDWTLVDEIELLHFEYYLPKGFELAEKDIKGYINGMEQSIFIDRESKDWGAIVHFMIGNNRLRELSNVMEGEDMKRAVIEIKAGSQEWSPVTSIKTSKGSMIADISWSPVTIDDKQETQFSIMFKDASTNEMLHGITYDISILDEDGNIVTERKMQDSSTQVYKFEQSGKYTILLSNINNSEEDATLSITVVPEFPFAIMMISIATFSLIVLKRVYLNGKNY